MQSLTIEFSQEGMKEKEEKEEEEEGEEEEGEGEEEGERGHKRSSLQGVID